MGYHSNSNFIIDYDYVDENNKLTYKGFLKYLREAGSIHSDEARIRNKRFWKNSFGLASFILET